MQWQESRPCRRCTLMMAGALLLLLLAPVVGCGRGGDKEEAAPPRTAYVPQTALPSDSLPAAAAPETPAEQTPGTAAPRTSGGESPAPGTGMAMDRSTAGSPGAERPATESPTAPRPAASPSQAAGERAGAGGYGPYCVQVGSFRRLGNAEKRQSELAAHGFEAVIVPADVHGEKYYRVWVPYFKSRDEAEMLGRRLQRELGLAYLVRQD